MPKTKENIRCCINSRARLNPLTETTSNFTFSFNDTVSRITEVIVSSIQVPFSFYTINSYNNVLKFNNGASSITITPGNYTAGTLSSELVSKMNAVFAGQSPVVTYSTTTFKLSISKSSAFILDASINVPSSTAASVLGFKISSTSGTTATGDSALNLAGPNYLLIKSEYLTNPIHHKTLYVNGNYQNVLFVLPINVSPGDTITHEPDTPIRFSYKKVIDNLDTFDLCLYDEFENPVDLNGLDWSIQLVFVTG